MELLKQRDILEVYQELVEAVRVELRRLFHKPDQYYDEQTIRITVDGILNYGDCDAVKVLQEEMALCPEFVYIARRDHTVFGIRSHPITSEVATRDEILRKYDRLFEANSHYIRFYSYLYHREIYMRKLYALLGCAVFAVGAVAAVCLI